MLKHRCSETEQETEDVKKTSCLSQTDEISILQNCQNRKQKQEIKRKTWRQMITSSACKNSGVSRD